MNLAKSFDVRNPLNFTRACYQISTALSGNLESKKLSCMTIPSSFISYLSIEVFRGLRCYGSHFCPDFGLQRSVLREQSLPLSRLTFSLRSGNKAKIISPACV